VLINTILFISRAYQFLEKENNSTVCSLAKGPSSRQLDEQFDSRNSIAYVLARASGMQILLF